MKSSALAEWMPMVAKNLQLACGLILTTQPPYIALYIATIMNNIVLGVKIAMEIQHQISASH